MKNNTHGRAIGAIGPGDVQKLAAAGLTVVDTTAYEKTRDDAATWKERAEQLSTTLIRVRTERDAAITEQGRLFHGMANASRELDAANARIAELERLLGETQAELGAAQEKAWQYEESGR